MTFLLISFIAGLLTVLAPCVLPLLPVIIGGAATDTRARLKPYVITASLAASVVLFTLLLKFATIFVDVPPEVWQWISGIILIFFGLITLFPDLWERGAAKMNLVLMRRSNEALAEGVKKESFWGDVIIGASLGPVFSSCSPTYFVILATVLPQSFAMGLIDLIAYAIGLSLALLSIALLGQKLVGKLGGASDPKGWLKRTLGAVFLLVGIFVITGWSAVVQTYLIANSPLDITKIETRLLQATTNDENELVIPKVNSSGSQASTSTPGSVSRSDGGVPISAKAQVYPKYRELANPSGFVNSNKFELKDIVGKKVILLDVMTYSCINCQRTFPYLRAWYTKYKDQGLEIVAIHTPEFAFEHKIENVDAAMKQYGLTFPVVLDNDYGTWNAYQNHYWPHKYLIDIDGYIRYDHIGEGGYEETERQIKDLLKERADKMGETVALGGIAASSIKEISTDARSQETYFGAYRNDEFMGEGTPHRQYDDIFTLPKEFIPNKYYLGGKWHIDDQFIESVGDSIVAFSYNAKEVYLVAEAQSGATIEVENGESNNTNVSVKAATLYTIVSNKSRQSGVFYLKVPKGVRLYSLTFG